MALVLSGQQPRAVSEDPDYPLGKLGVPPFAEPASPIRLVDIDAAFTEEGTSTSALEARLKLGGRAFVGGEVRGDRRGAFFDTQRFEIGLTEEDGRLDVEGSLRAPWFLVRIDAARREGLWAFESEGSVRVSTDWEVLFAYGNDENDRGGGPPSVEDFIETSRLPPPAPPTRTVRAGRLGFLYQRDNNIELETGIGVSRVRTEAGFEFDRRELTARTVWNHLPFELDGAVSLARIGRTRRTEGRGEIGVAMQLGTHWIVSGRTVQDWQPDVERSVRDYAAGLTFFGRRFRFERASEAAEEMLALQRRVNALGYNERRVYRIDELRALRDRLSISPAQRELASALNALYVAQVRSRNVPQLGVELTHTTREVEGSTTRGYRAFVGVPWPPRWPFATGDAVVEFVRVDFLLEEERFPSVGWTRRGYRVSASVELNREHAVRFRWVDPGQTPEELSRRIVRPHRFTIEYAYALGR